MLTIIKGTYRNGHIEVQESPVDVQDETPVIVTFPNGTAIDLRAHGMGEGEARELRAALATVGFPDCNTLT